MAQHMPAVATLLFWALPLQETAKQSCRRSKYLSRVQLGGGDRTTTELLNHGLYFRPPTGVANRVITFEEPRSGDWIATLPFKEQKLEVVVGLPLSRLTMESDYLSKAKPGSDDWVTTKSLDLGWPFGLHLHHFCLSSSLHA